jgi:hypothetical protein
MPRPRKDEHADLPDNLYHSGGYYTWRDPRDGTRHGIGTDRADAIAQAIEANQYIAAPRRLAERIAAPGRSVADFLPKYRDILKTRSLADITRYHRLRHAVAIEQALGKMTIGPRMEDAADITRQAAEWLQDYVSDDKLRMAKALRSTLIDLFAEIAAAGWTAINPIEVIRIQPARIKRMRLTLDSFWKIYNAAAQLDPWVQHSMALGLVSLQRREDISRMEFKAQQDGRQLVEQQKSRRNGEIQTRIRIPLTLRLDAVDWTLGDIIARCRDKVLSRHLLHHTLHQGLAKPGDPVHPATITDAFARARDLAGITAPEGKTPPTYHELRSLGIRLYQAQGYDPQGLAGHKEASTTAVYKDARGAEWIDIAA